MIKLLILHNLNKKVLTMYGISREIKSEFSVLTLPSFGTIKPALELLENKGFIKSQKTMSSGGRPASLYSITEKGKDELKKLILEKPTENPIQFLIHSRIKLICSEVLDKDEQKKLFQNLKFKAENLLLDSKNLLENCKNDFRKRLVTDNIVCEYKNFIMLLEGLERACKN